MPLLFIAPRVFRLKNFIRHARNMNGTAQAENAVCRHVMYMPKCSGIKSTNTAFKSSLSTQAGPAEGTESENG
jgi:hypothetical protein